LLKVYELINTILSDLGIEVYNEYIPQDKPFPYIKFSCPSIGEGESYRQNILLYVDIWDKNTDIINIENLSNEVDLRLNRVKSITDTMQISIYRDNLWKLSIPDEDLEIRRRRLVYIVKIYKIGE
jgi:hypothetical protein